MLHHLLLDVRHALRSLSRRPGFAAAAIVTIALGVGVNTGVFSVVNGALFRDIPAARGHELVSVYQRIEGVAERERTLVGLSSTDEVAAYRDRATTLVAVAGHSDPVGALLGGAAPEQLAGLLVTCGYFDLLGAPPVIGRGLTEENCRAGADPVIVLGHDFWETTFAADPSIVGRTIELARQLFTVVGIAPEDTYSGMFRAAFFAPVSAQSLLSPSESDFANPRAGWLHLLGRRGPGVGVDEVRAELAVIAAQIDAEEPGRSTTLTIERAKPLTVPPFVRGAAVGAGTVVLAAFALILLIACANVANLMLAQGLARNREIAVRLSLGASRAAVVRRLLVESLLLSIVGGALGSLIALASFEPLLALALPTVAPVGLPPLGLDVSPDVRVLAASVLITFGAGALFGLLPAWSTSKVDLSSALKQESLGARRGSRLQAAFVGAQVALSMVLMIGAGLLLRGLHAAHTAEPGFDYRDVAVLSYDYVSDTGHAPDSAFWLDLEREIAALPGVEATAYVVREPLGDDYVTGAIRLPGAAAEDVRTAELNWVGPEFFAALDLPIVVGRAFVSADADDAPRVAIVSESTARNLWPRDDALGRTVLWRPARGEEIELTVVGVAQDAQIRSLGEVDARYVYLPARVGEKLLVESSADFETTAAGIRAVVSRLDPGLPVPVYALETNFERWRNVSKVVTTAAATLAALALTLAAVGIYGVVSHFVGRRVREIGIRIALGAEAPKVLGLILRRTMRPVVIGAALGIAGGVTVSGILRSMLFGVNPVDAVGLLGAALFVLCVALASGAAVARRAARVDPMVTLRYE